MKLLLAVLLSELVLIASARPSSGINDAEPLPSSPIPQPSTTRISEANDTDKSSKAASTPASGVGNVSKTEVVDELPVTRTVPEGPGSKTATNEDGSRMSFMEAIGLIANRTRLINDHASGLRKAYNESGILGAADYLASLPDTLGDRPVIGFYNATVTKNETTTVVTASLNQILPVNGPPFVFKLSDVLLEILDGVLETKLVKDEQGQNIRVAVAHNPSNVLLNVARG